MKTVRGSVKGIDYSAGEIASGNTDLSSRIDEVGISVRQTAASM
ncbi:MAG: hypothetical protein ACR5K7_00060 [Symbiopectobacterium sp.]